MSRKNSRWIAELLTGEGKTEAALMRSYIKAIEGRRSLVVTTTDHLAEIGFNEKAVPVLQELLGLDIGLVKREMEGKEQRDRDAARQAAYKKEVVYTAIDTWAFDVLHDKDNTPDIRRGERYIYQGEDYFKHLKKIDPCLDEVDNLLIEQARTQFIISGHVGPLNMRDQIRLRAAAKAVLPSNIEIARLDIFAMRLTGKEINLRTSDVRQTKDLVERIDKEGKYDAWINPITGEVGLTAKGKERLQNIVLIGLEYLRGYKSVTIDRNILDEIMVKEVIKNWDEKAIEKWTTYIRQALQAEYIHQLEKDYVVRDNTVLLVSKNTGRTQTNQRLQGNLHQLIEAKHDLTIRSENRTISRITAKNLLDLSGDVSGTTGTMTGNFIEMSMMKNLYDMDIFKVAPHNVVHRTDIPEQFYKTERERTTVLLSMVKDAIEKKKPLIIHALDIQDAFRIKRILEKEGLTQLLANADMQADVHNYFQMLDATNEYEETVIVERAALPGMITISTPISGRGTDIKIKEAARIYGLQQISMGYYDSRRIDLQVRGRSGRQGMLGLTVNLVCLEAQIDFLKRGFARGGYYLEMAQDMLAGKTKFDTNLLKTAFEKAQKNITKIEVEHIKQQAKEEDIIFELSNKLISLIDSRSSIRYELDTPGYLAMSIHRIVDRCMGSAITNKGFQEVLKEIKTSFGIELKLSNIESALRSTNLDDVKLTIGRILTNHFTHLMVDEINAQAKGEFYKGLDRSDNKRKDAQKFYEEARGKIANETITINGQELYGIDENSLGQFIRYHLTQQKYNMQEVRNLLRDAKKSREAGDDIRAREQLLMVIEIESDNREAQELLKGINKTIEKRAQEEVRISEEAAIKRAGEFERVTTKEVEFKETKGLGLFERIKARLMGRNIGLGVRLVDVPIVQVSKTQETQRVIEANLEAALNEDKVADIKKDMTQRRQAIAVNGQSVTVIRTKVEEADALAIVAKAIVKTRDAKGNIPQIIVLISHGMKPEDEEKAVQEAVGKIAIEKGKISIISTMHDTTFILAKPEAELIAAKYLELTDSKVLTVADVDSVFAKIMEAENFGTFFLGETEFKVLMAKDGMRIVTNAVGIDEDERRVLRQLEVMVEGKGLSRLNSSMLKELAKTNPYIAALMLKLVRLSSTKEFIALNELYQRRLINVGDNGRITFGKAELSVSDFYNLMQKRGLYNPNEKFAIFTRWQIIINAIKKFFSRDKNEEETKHAIRALKAELMIPKEFYATSTTEGIERFRLATLKTKGFADLKKRDRDLIAEIVNAVEPENDAITERTREEVIEDIIEALFQIPKPSTFADRLEALVDNYMKKEEYKKALIVLSIMLKLESHNASYYDRLASLYDIALGNSEKALELYTVALILSGGNLDYAVKSYRITRELDKGEINGEYTKSIISQTGDLLIEKRGNTKEELILIGLAQASVGHTSNALFILRKAANLAENATDRKNILVEAAKVASRERMPVSGIIKHGGLKEVGLTTKLIEKVVKGLSLVRKTGLTPDELKEAKLIDASTALALNNMGAKRSIISDISERIKLAISNLKDSIETSWKAERPVTKLIAKATGIGLLLILTPYIGIEVTIQKAVPIALILFMSMKSTKLKDIDLQNEKLKKLISFVGKSASSGLTRLMLITPMLIEGWYAKIAVTAIIAMFKPLMKLAKIIYSRVSDKHAFNNIQKSNSKLFTALKETEDISEGSRTFDKVSKIAEKNGLKDVNILIELLGLNVESAKSLEVELTSKDVIEMGATLDALTVSDMRNIVAATKELREAMAKQEFKGRLTLQKLLEIAKKHDIKPGTISFMNLVLLVDLLDVRRLIGQDVVGIENNTNAVHDLLAKAITIYDALMSIDTSLAKDISLSDFGFTDQMPINIDKLDKDNTIFIKYIINNTQNVQLKGRMTKLLNKIEDANRQGRHLTYRECIEIAIGEILPGKALTVESAMEIERYYIEKFVSIMSSLLKAFNYRMSTWDASNGAKYALTEYFIEKAHEEEAKGNYKDAIKFANKAEKLHMPYKAESGRLKVEAHYVKAEKLIEAGKFNQAIAEINRAEKLNPGIKSRTNTLKAEIFYKKALLYAKSDRFDLASEYIEKAVVVDASAFIKADRELIDYVKRFAAKADELIERAIRFNENKKNNLTLAIKLLNAAYILYGAAGYRGTDIRSEIERNKKVAESELSKIRGEEIAAMKQTPPAGTPKPVAEEKKKSTTELGGQAAFAGAGLGAVELGLGGTVIVAAAMLGFGILVLYNQIRWRQGEQKRLGERAPPPSYKEQLFHLPTAVATSFTQIRSFFANIISALSFRRAAKVTQKPSRYALLGAITFSTILAAITLVGGGANITFLTETAKPVTKTQQLEQALLQQRTERLLAPMSKDEFNEIKDSRRDIIGDISYEDFLTLQDNKNLKKDLVKAIEFMHRVNPDRTDELLKVINHFVILDISVQAMADVESGTIIIGKRHLEEIAQKESLLADLVLVVVHEGKHREDFVNGLSSENIDFRSRAIDEERAYRETLDWMRRLGYPTETLYIQEFVTEHIRDVNYRGAVAAMVTASRDTIPANIVAIAKAVQSGVLPTDVQYISAPTIITDNKEEFVCVEFIKDGRVHIANITYDGKITLEPFPVSVKYYVDRIMDDDYVVENRQVFLDSLIKLAKTNKDAREALTGLKDNIEQKITELVEKMERETRDAAEDTRISIEEYKALGRSIEGAIKQKVGTTLYSIPPALWAAIGIPMLAGIIFGPEGFLAGVAGILAYFGHKLYATLKSLRAETPTVGKAPEKAYTALKDKIVVLAKDLKKFSETSADAVPEIKRHARDTSLKIQGAELSRLLDEAVSLHLLTKAERTLILRLDLTPLAAWNKDLIKRQLIESMEPSYRRQMDMINKIKANELKNIEAWRRRLEDNEPKDRLAAIEWVQSIEMDIITAQGKLVVIGAKLTPEEENSIKEAIRAVSQAKERIIRETRVAKQLLIGEDIFPTYKPVIELLIKYYMSELLKMAGRDPRQIQSMKITSITEGEGTTKYVLKVEIRVNGNNELIKLNLIKGNQYVVSDKAVNEVMENCEEEADQSKKLKAFGVATQTFGSLNLKQMIRERLTTEKDASRRKDLEDFDTALLAASIIGVTIGEFVETDERVAISIPDIPTERGIAPIHYPDMLKVIFKAWLLTFNEKGNYKGFTIGDLKPANFIYDLKDKTVKYVDVGLPQYLDLDGLIEKILNDLCARCLPISDDVIIEAAGKAMKEYLETNPDEATCINLSNEIEGEIESQQRLSQEGSLVANILTANILKEMLKQIKTPSVEAEKPTTEIQQEIIDDLKNAGVDVSAIPQNEITDAASAVADGEQGILRRGQVVTIRVDEMDYVINGKDENVGEIVLDVMKSRNDIRADIKENIIKALESSSGYEVGFKVVRAADGTLRLEVSNKATIEIKNGEMINRNVRRDFYQGEDVVYSAHTHIGEITDIRQVGGDAIAAIQIEKICGKPIVEHILQLTKSGIIASILQHNERGIFTLTGKVSGELYVNELPVNESELVKSERKTVGEKVITHIIALIRDDYLMIAEVREVETGRFEITAKTYRTREEKVVPSARELEEILKQGPLPSQLELAPPVGPEVLTGAIRPEGKLVSAEYGQIPGEITDGTIRALGERLKRMQESGMMTGMFVVAAELDSIEKNGAFIEGTGLEAMARLAKQEEGKVGGGLFRLAVWTKSDGMSRAEKVKEDLEAIGGSVEIINIDERGDKTLSAYIAERFGNIPQNNIGIGLMNTEENRGLIEKEFSVNGNNSASIVLIDGKVISRNKANAQVAYIPLVNAIKAATVKGTAFLGLGIDEGDIADFVANIRRLVSGIVIRFIKIGEELQNWINSVNAVSIAA